jgi:hypothetical protein
MTNTTDEKLGKLNFEAFCKTTGFTSGCKFYELPRDKQKGWITAAKAVELEIRREVNDVSVTINVV